MNTCEQCANLFWDHLYGLLDAEQAQTLREHLAGCPSCQAGFVQAEAQQGLVARAARLYDTVAPFVPPDAEPTPVTEPTISQAAQPVAPPEVIALKAKPARTRRRWPWLAAAAALLLLVGGYAWYQHGLTERREERARAWEPVRHINEEMAQANRETEKEFKELPRTLQAQQLNVQVVGPASYQRGAPNQYRVTTRKLNGAPVGAEVSARVVAASRDKSARSQVLSEKKFRIRGDRQDRGEKTFSLAPDLNIPAASVVRLEVEAKSREARTQVHDRLSVVPSTFLTHLALDKTLYRHGEMLFFRTLTLERFSNKPAAGKFQFIASLVDVQGAKRVQHPGAIRPDGIGGGEFALTNNLPAGEWTLEVAETKGRFPPVARRFLLAQNPSAPLDAQVTFDRLAYGPGENVRARLQARGLEKGANVGNQPVKASLDINGKPAPVSGNAAQRTNLLGQADINLRLPQSMSRGTAQLKIQLGTGANSATVVQPIPHLDVEFFPEGGHLVAGLPSRVYFRARRLDKPVDVRGQILDGQGRVVVIKDQQGRDVKELTTTRQQGLGFFRFTPKARESYAVRILSPSGVTARPKLPTVQERGVVLEVPGAVSHEGEAIPIQVRNQGLDSGLIVATSCRGRLVDQKAIRAGRDEVWVELNPPAGAHGVLRVTVYEPRAGQLVPLAERLVYRLPARRLQVTVKTGKQVYSPRERVTLQLETANEKDQPASSMLLASVVDESALQLGEHSAEGGLPAQFFLTTDLHRAEDLEQADIWVRDNPAAFAALDQFLGTQGWRRFVSTGEPAKPATALVMKRGKQARSLTETGQLALLNLDNGLVVQNQYQAALHEAREMVAATAGRRMDELAQTKAEHIDQARRAEAALADFQALPSLALRWGLIGCTLLLFATGCIALVIGLVRTVRGSIGNTPYFGTAFASLLLCMIALYADRRDKPIPPGRDRDDSRELAGHDRQQQAPLAGEEFVPRTRPLVPEGLYAALPQAPAPVAKAKDPELAQNLASNRQVALTALRREQMKGDDKAPSSAPAKKDGRPEMLMVPHRFKAAKQNQEARRADMAKDGAEKGKKKEGKPGDRGVGKATSGSALDLKKRAREAGEVPVQYALVYPGDERSMGLHFQDTVLWSPVLAAPNGKAQVSFELPDNITTFRILVYGHTLEGRIGVAHGKLVSQAAVPQSKPTKRSGPK